MPRLIHIRSAVPMDGACSSCVFFEDTHEDCARPNGDTRCPLPMRLVYGSGRADQRVATPVGHLIAEELHETKTGRRHGERR